MTKEMNFDLVVIGGGIVGLASAYKIQGRYSDVRIAVLEKEDELAMHQTGRNSGVIHSGLYYKPGSSKALNCIKGRMQLIRFAEEHNIPHQICGKIIVATEEAQLKRLEEVFGNGQQNQIEGIEKITPEQIRKIEPYCGGIAGIYVPCTGIIDFKQVARKLAELIRTKSKTAAILTRTKATGIDKNGSVTTVITNNGIFKTKFLINCAGLQSDRIARMDGLNPSVRIVPFRGDYYELTEAAAHKVKNLIYPVPDPAFPFLGVHFTRMINGTVEAGPNAVFSFKREGYGKFDFSLKDAWDAIGFGGTWKLFLRNYKYGINEYKKALFKRAFLSHLQKLVPSLTAQDIKPSRAGVRAQAVGPGGEVIDDFRIEKGFNSIHVLNAPSPAATACLAIGETISQIAAEHFKL
jgi:L-2-hydroxyglutarate oxidase LhgO